MLHAVYATVAETHLALLRSCPCETRYRSVAALLKNKYFEGLYALNFVCDTISGEKSFIQTLLNAMDCYMPKINDSTNTLS